MKLRDRWRYSATNTRFWNWRNRRTLTRGRRDLAARAGDQVRSRTPVVRARINPATGRQHRNDRQIGRTADRALARMRPTDPQTWGAMDAPERRLDRRTQQVLTRKRAGRN